MLEDTRPQAHSLPSVSHSEAEALGARGTLMQPQLHDSSLSQHGYSGSPRLALSGDGGSNQVRHPCATIPVCFCPGGASGLVSGSVDCDPGTWDTAWSPVTDSMRITFMLVYWAHSWQPAGLLHLSPASPGKSLPMAGSEEETLAAMSWYSGGVIYCSNVCTALVKMQMMLEVAMAGSADAVDLLQHSPLARPPPASMACINVPDAVPHDQQHPIA